MEDSLEEDIEGDREAGDVVEKMNLKMLPIKVFAVRIS